MGDPEERCHLYPKGDGGEFVTQPDNKMLPSTES